MHGRTLFFNAQPKKPQHQSDNTMLNYWHLDALKVLSSSGLTAEMLLSPHHKHCFYEDHSLALKRLVLSLDFSVTRALAEIRDLSETQAGGIHGGLRRSEVLKTNNFSKISALCKLKKHGLTIQMLLSLNLNGNEFALNHYFALEKLVLDRHFSIEQALARIEGLNDSQAKEIVDEGTSEDSLCNALRR